jgi:lambda repressor-like predicted transcriptional regulator
VGLLQRRQVRIDYIVPIGKESNNLEGVEAGVVHSEQDVYTEYPDPGRDQWESQIRPALNKISLSVLQKQSGLSRRTLINARTGNHRPHPKNQELLARIVRKLGVT